MRGQPESSLLEFKMNQQIPSFPVNGSDNENPLVTYEEGRNWVVLHTRPRCEKKAEDFCRRNDIPVYLPLQRKLHRYGARERAFWSPLFPGYVFCAATAPQQSTLRQNQHIANVLLVHQPIVLLQQLNQIRQALSLGDVVEVLPYLETGKSVSVSGGAFKGLEGVVVRVKGKTRVVINVDMIQQAVSVEVDSCYLKPC